MKALLLLLLSTSSIMALPVEFRNYSGNVVVVSNGPVSLVLPPGVSRLDLANATWDVIASNYFSNLLVDSSGLTLGKSELVATADRTAGVVVTEVDGWWMTFLRGMAFAVSVCGLALITRIIRKVAAPGVEV